jgi:hypothetical protein
MRYYWLRSRVPPLKPQRTSRTPAPVDLLAAIFSVNRSAKRHRDAAQTYYRQRMHGFAGRARETKEDLYALKDRGIAQAHNEGRLTYHGRHGGLAIYTGEGYCFHSTLVPEEAVEEPSPANDDQTPIFVEGKPRGSKEARLCDAQFTLARIPASILDSGYEQLSAPRVPQRNPPPQYPPSQEEDDEKDWQEADDEEDWQDEP